MKTSDWVILISACVPVVALVGWWLIDQMAETFDDTGADWQLKEQERESAWHDLARRGESKYSDWGKP